MLHALTPVVIDVISIGPGRIHCKGLFVGEFGRRFRHVDAFFALWNVAAGANRWQQIDHKGENVECKD